jgi:hypothetical protein
VRIPFSRSIPADGNYATAEFGANVYRPADLNLFFNSFRPDQVNNTPTLVSVAGVSFVCSLLSLGCAHHLLILILTRNPNVSGRLGESSLDIKLVVGLLGAGQNLSLYQVVQPRASFDPSAFFFVLFLCFSLSLSNLFSLHGCTLEFRGARSLSRAFRGAFLDADLVLVYSG